MASSTRPHRLYPGPADGDGPRHDQLQTRTLFLEDCPSALAHSERRKLAFIEIAHQDRIGTGAKPVSLPS